jgi:hypothetical protein
VSESRGDKGDAGQAPVGSYINLNAFESDEFGVPRAFVHIQPITADMILASTLDPPTFVFVKKSVESRSADVDNAMPHCGATFAGLEV